MKVSSCTKNSKGTDRTNYNTDNAKNLERQTLESRVGYSYSNVAVTVWDLKCTEGELIG